MFWRRDENNQGAFLVRERVTGRPRARCLASVSSMVSILRASRLANTTSVLLGPTDSLLANSVHSRRNARLLPLSPPDLLQATGAGRERRCHGM
jgi:hypothetical protein